MSEQTTLDQTEKQSAEIQQSEQKQPVTFKSILCDFLDVAEVVPITFFVFLLLYAYLLVPVTVDGGSRNPTLYNSDKILLLDNFYHPKNGNIVVIDDKEGALFTDAEQTTLTTTNGLGIVLVKRLIAKGGQEINIDFEHGTVAVDGQQLLEPYTAAYELPMRNDQAFSYPFTVPEGYVFVMGDNRNGSTDSRNPGVALVPEDQIIGTAFLRYDRDAEYTVKWYDRFAWLL